MLAELFEYIYLARDDKDTTSTRPRGDHQPLILGYLINRYTKCDNSNKSHDRVIGIGRNWGL